MPAARGSLPGGTACPSTASWWAWPRSSRGAGRSSSPGGRSPRSPSLHYTEAPPWWARRRRAEDPAERSVQCLFKYFVCEAGILNQILIRRPSFLYLCFLKVEALPFSQQQGENSQGFCVLRSPRCSLWHFIDNNIITGRPHAPHSCCLSHLSLREMRLKDYLAGFAVSGQGAEGGSGIIAGLGW